MEISSIFHQRHRLDRSLPDALPWLAITALGLLAVIRKLFGLGSDSGVTKVVSRLNARMEKESELVSRYNVLCRDLTP